MIKSEFFTGNFIPQFIQQCMHRYIFVCVRCSTPVNLYLKQLSQLLTFFNAYLVLVKMSRNAYSASTVVSVTRSQDDHFPIPHHLDINGIQQSRLMDNNGHNKLTFCIIKHIKHLYITACGSSFYWLFCRCVVNPIQSNIHVKVDLTTAAKETEMGHISGALEMSTT